MDVDLEAMTNERPRNKSKEEEAQFLVRIYTHLMLAIAACVGGLTLFMNSAMFEPAFNFMMSVNWLIPLGLFILFSFVGEALAHKRSSKGLQYVGLFIGVMAYSVLLSPLIHIVETEAGGHVIQNAALLTGVVFVTLTAAVLYTRKDFSFMRPALYTASVIALALIVIGSLTGFTLGLWFAVAMVGYSAAVILYQTSVALHEYPKDMYVGAALGIFSALGMLFWYILQILYLQD